MPRLGISHPNLPKHVRCPRCEATFNSKDILTHIPGCFRCSGFNATSKHNALVRFLYEMCLKAGIACEREPRSLSTWTCLTCRSIVNISNEQWHHKVCPGKHLHRSGPDLVIYWNTGPVFYDLTIVHELAASNRTQKKFNAHEKRHTTQNCQIRKTWDAINRKLPMPSVSLRGIFIPEHKTTHFCAGRRGPIRSE